MKKLILILVIIFGGILIQAQEYNSKEALTKIGNIEVEIDALNKSVTITKQGIEVLDLSCSFMCYEYIATTYEVEYSGYDGAIDPNETLITLESAMKNGIPIFKLTDYKNDIIGVVLGSAGASGGGSQTLYLIDIITGKSCEISSGDMREPKWFTTNGKFGYIETTYRYIGGRMGSMGMDVVREVNAFNPSDFNFQLDSLALLETYQSELSKVSLSSNELELLKGKSSEDLFHLYFNKDDEVYRDLIKRLVAEVYYLKQLNQVDFIRKNIFPYLDDNLIEEFTYLLD